MSHTTNKIYIDSNTSPVTGVSVADVQSVLRRGTGDVGLLCSDQEWYDNNGTETLRVVGKVNHWAKYKPVRSSALAILTEADRQDLYYGMSVPIYGSGYTTNIADFITAYEAGWSYLRPRGKNYDGNGGNEWFRLLDFNGYNHDANCFYFPNGSTLPTEYVYGQSNQAGCTWSLGLNTGTSLHDDSIGIGDIKLGGHEGTAFSSLYFGLIFVTGTTPKTYKIVTNTTATFGQTGGNEVTITEPNNDGLAGLSTSGTYTVYPILCTSNTHGTPGNIENTDIIVGLPVEPFTFHQTNEATQLALTLTNPSARWDDERARLTVSVRVGMRSTGGTHSIQTILYTIQAASSTSDTSGSRITSGSVGPINDYDPLTAQIYYQGRPTRPNYVRVHVEAYGHTGVEKTQYIAVRDGDFPDPEPPSDIE